MSEIIIVANGLMADKAFHKKIFSREAIIICADGALMRLQQLGIRPDYIVGDMDSVDISALNNIKALNNKEGKTSIVCIKDQETTDLQKCVDKALALNPTRIIFLGCFGNNIDHTLGNILCMIKIPESISTVMIDEHNELYIVRKSITIYGYKGQIVSIIPLSEVRGLTYKGLYWRMGNASKPLGWLGIRNKLVNKKATINIDSGVLLVIKNYG